MNKKNTIKHTAAIFLGLALTLGATGCDFIRTDNAKDMAQTIATVNIAADLEGAQATELSALISANGVQTDIPKRDLVAYFLNVGYTYVQQYGYTYKATFEMLLDTLVSRKIVAQYAVAYYVTEAGLTAEGCAAYLQSELSAVSGKKKELLENHPEVSAMKYFLTNGGTEMEEYDKAIYSLKSSINSSLDSAEANYISEQEDAHNHGDVRTLPTNVGTEKSDYYVAPVTVGGETKKYEVYTGLNDASACYGYEEVDGSTKTTRMKAYSDFLGNLDDNALLLSTDNTSDFEEVDYYYVELGSQLEQALINKYTEDLIENGENELTDGTVSYLSSRYEETYQAQKLAYDKDASAFETAVDSLSDDSFVMYSPLDNYGFVYNILIPFTSEQTRDITAENGRTTKETEQYAYRAKVLAEVKAADLRDSWFCEEEHANYAFKAEAGSYYGDASNYIFFEDNFTNTEKYESLKMYLGKYAYNGTVTEKEDGGYKTKANKMLVNAEDGGFLKEMEAYLGYAVGDASAVSGEYFSKYVTKAEDYTLDAAGDFADYGEFIYYAGKVDFAKLGVTASAKDYFVKDTAVYNAAAAFNELMFAYSTDTGCLNTYMGYMVSPFTTNFVPEFEYAAQYAIRELGVGGYVVCPSTYGWHIIYVTHVYKQGDVYGGFDKDAMDTEGSFSNLYAEAMKSSYSSQFANSIQSALITQYNNDDCVTRIVSAYQDLLDLDNQ